jgi:hypothetical protein
VTDRYSGFVVRLDGDIREDDAQDVITALRQIRFVASVEPVTSDQIGEAIAVGRRDDQWQRELQDVLSRMRMRGLHG